MSDKKWDGKNRVMVLWVPSDMMPELLGLTRFETRLINVPEGCRLVRSYHDWVRDAFGLLLSHPSFEPVEAGEYPPTLLAQYRRTLKPGGG